MLREISSGGVVVRQVRGNWELAVIEPAGRAPQRSDRKPTKRVLALPKGWVDKGEKPDQTAIREVREETGLTASLVEKLGDIRYTYVRSWAGGEKVFKIVSFYLLKYASGEIGDISAEMRNEVIHAEWVALAEAPKLLTYKGEREMAVKAIAYIEAHPKF